jgi:hypothetical protein
MLYAYETNQSAFRTHDEFVQDAQLAALEGERTGHEVIVNGVRGVSPLLSILQYPVSVIYDYMHLVCLRGGHDPPSALFYVLIG